MNHSRKMLWILYDINFYQPWSCSFIVTGARVRGDTDVHILMEMPFYAVLWLSTFKCWRAWWWMSSTRSTTLSVTDCFLGWPPIIGHRVGVALSRTPCWQASRILSHALMLCKLAGRWVPSHPYLSGSQKRPTSLRCSSSLFTVFHHDIRLRVQGSGPCRAYPQALEHLFHEPRLELTALVTVQLLRDPGTIEEVGHLSICHG